MTKIIGPVNLLETSDEADEVAIQPTEVTENEPEQLIVVKQIPIIIEKLESVKSEIEHKVNVACSMVCTDENYKEIKKSVRLSTKSLSSLKLKENLLSQK